MGSDIDPDAEEIHSIILSVVTNSDKGEGEWSGEDTDSKDPSTIHFQPRITEDF